jgi:hypothetical protein
MMIMLISKSTFDRIMDIMRMCKKTTARHQTTCDAKESDKGSYKNHIHLVEVLEDALVLFWLARSI